MSDELEKYRNLSNDEALVSLKSSESGLSEDTAAECLKIYGYNEIIRGPKRSVFIQSVLHSLNPLVGILFVAATISAFSGNIPNASIILAILIISVLIDYLQSHRSLKAIQHLQSQVALQSTVLRDNIWKDIPAKVLVPGDIIRLTAGDLVPADALLLTSKDLHVQQGLLTGESLPVEKEAYVNSDPTINLITTKEAIHEVKKLIFFGSSIVSGTATAVVLFTGTQTMYGEIAKDLSVRPPPTEFDKGIVEFGLFISKTIIFMVLFIFIVSIFLKRDILESLMFAVALAVGLTPEFLPMITTVTLATGALRMARKNVIVKNLSSLQNLGSIDILCSDKTGTLTTGEMTLEKYILLSGQSSEKLLLFSYLNSLFQSGVEYPSNLAILKHINVNPLDAAILKHAHPDTCSYQKIDELPFDFERRSSSIIVGYEDKHVLIAKGAPEYLIKKCTSYDNGNEAIAIDQEVLDLYMKLFKSFSADGYRLLTIAYRVFDQQKLAYNVSDENGLTLSGLLVFSDPPLQDAEQVIASLAKEGVKVKILTGDNELVTENICRRVGINPGHIVLGSEIEEMSQQVLAAKAENIIAFARVSPSQKQKIILSLRSRGHIVGYIGDGINDAPSLHSADVGISVAGAADVARESADIILLKRHLNVLLNGIIEGRQAFGNVMKYLMMGTSSNFGNMFSMAAAVFFLPFLPMLPIQILLNNMLYDIAQITIPTDHVDKNFTKKPRHWELGLIRRFMFFIGPISSIFDFMTFFVMIYIFSASESMFQTGWFVESLATQTLVIFVIRTAQNPLRSRPSLPLCITVFSTVLIGMYLPFSPFSTLLGFTPLPLNYFVFLISATSIYLFLVQLVKQRLIWRWFS